MDERLRSGRNEPPSENGNTLRVGDGWACSFSRTGKDREKYRNSAYGFFLVHMLLCGSLMFMVAYFGDAGPAYYVLSTAFALGYVLFYIDVFGIDAVRWALINGVLGIFGIYAQLGWILALFGAEPDDYTWTQHAMPVFYYVMYTFLLHQLVLDLAKARDNPSRRRLVDAFYVLGSILVYGTILVFG